MYCSVNVIVTRSSFSVPIQVSLQSDVFLIQPSLCPILPLYDIGAVTRMNPKLRSIRAGHRSAVSKLIKKYEDIRQDENGAVDTEELSNILNSLKRQKELLHKLDEDIVQELEEGEVEAEIVEAAEYDFNLEGNIRQINKLILVKTSSLNTNADSFTSSRAEFTRQVQPTISSATENQNISNFRFPDFRSSSSYTSEHNKLPKLNLPTFDGDILQWQSFWDSYETAVHTNPTLGNVQKFNYLKSLLYNEALKTVTGFALTNANYEKAISLLHERYGQEHKITQKYMQALIDIPPPKYTLSSLRNYYDQIEIYIRGLESLGQNDDSYGALLVPIVLNKLPGEIRKNLARVFGSTNIRLNDLRRGIFEELNIMEAGKAHDAIENPTATAAFLTNTKSRNRQPSNTYSSNKTQQKTNSQPKKCVYCHEQHPSVSCTKVKEQKARMSIVKKDRLCFNCLGHHNLADCKSKYSCKNCHRRHHTSLCAESGQNNTESEKQENVNVGTIQNNAKESDHILHSQGPTNVLLKTAINPVSSGQHTLDANILFDEGAQRSFLTEELAAKLKLQITGNESLNLSGFGDTAESTRVRHLKTAIIYLVTEEGQNLPIRVLIVPEIAAPLKIYVRKVANLPYLSGIKLAHPITNNDNFEVSLLIGADYYWSIVENHVIRGEGPTAVKSRIGYLLSGPLQTTTTEKSGRTLMMNIMISRNTEEYDLEKFWKIESSGTELADEKSAAGNTEFHSIYKNTCISYHDNRYFVMLPWKEEHPPLPTNKEIAQRRTENVIKRLQREPELLKKYGEIIEEQEKRNFIQKVHTDPEEGDIVHYIPHHHVKKESTTTPIRIVFDCSCKATPDSPSLNDCLRNTTRS